MTAAYPEEHPEKKTPVLDVEIDTSNTVQLEKSMAEVDAIATHKPDQLEKDVRASLKEIHEFHGAKFLKNPPAEKFMKATYLADLKFREMDHLLFAQQHQG
jgi:hypothetical protein